jgi:hypothetical protein
LCTAIAWWLGCSGFFLLENLKSVFPFSAPSGIFWPIDFRILRECRQGEEKKNKDKT